MSNLWRYDCWAKPRINPFAAPVAKPESAPPVEVAPETKEEIKAPLLEELSVEELRTQARVMGISVHHRAGRDKLLSAIRGTK